jgi:hypothetical protein
VSSAGASSGGGAGDGAGGTSSGGTSGTGGTAGNAGAACAIDSYEGHEYAFCESRVTAAEAAADCGLKGMKLAGIDSAGENDFVWNAMLSWVNVSPPNKPSEWIWLGGAAQPFGEWHWPDGTHFWTGGSKGSAVGGAYTAWATNEPDNALACMIMQTVNRLWSAYDCANTQRYACEAF